jgi:hypothetical protein
MVLCPLQGATTERDNDIIVAVGVEGRINVDEVNAGIGELAELVEIVAAIDDPRVHEG